jgi:hypothetical protein
MKQGLLRTGDVGEHCLDVRTEEMGCDLVNT